VDVGTADDCAALPISLNLAGIKPFMREIGVSAVMSVPRLGFMDNFFCAFEALPPLRIKLRRYTGAYLEPMHRARDRGNDRAGQARRDPDLRLRQCVCAAPRWRWMAR
jgi:hypothetical protein